jgi:hypothetical protein
MDPFSATASIFAILQLSNKVVGYLNDAKDAFKDRAKCAIETANLSSLFTTIRFRRKDTDSTTPWYTTMRALSVKNRPLGQLKQALEELQTRMAGEGKLGKIRDA